MDRHELAAACEDMVKDKNFAPKLLCKKCGQPEDNHERGGHKFIEDVLVTYCNVAAHRIACLYGYDKFKGLLANEIIDTIKKDKRWVAVEAKDAATCAWAGRLVIAALKGQPHGHSAVVYPGGLTHSGKWGGDAPVVANVGKENGIMGANFAFRDEPVYWLLSDA